MLLARYTKRNRPCSALWMRLRLHRVKIRNDAVDMEVNEGLLPFFAEEEVTVLVVVHEEVFGEDGGPAVGTTRSRGGSARAGRWPFPPAPEIKEHFGQNDDRVELTLRIGQSTSSPGKGTESELKSTLKSGQKIVELMRENPSITIAELILRLGLSRSGVNKQIAKLKADGVIEREGSDKSGRWIVK